MHTPAASDRPLRTVYVGAGAGIFTQHEHAFDPAQFEIVALADVSPQAQARADAHGVPFFTDHRAMCAALQPDVAVIITPHPFHAPIAIDALNRGAHVLVEKPVAVHAGEADAMIEAAAQNQRVLAVNFQQRFRPEIRAAYDVVQSGRLGKLQYVNMVVVWPRTRKYFATATWRGTWRGEGGGVLLNQAPHNLDLLTHLMGLPSRLVAWTRTTMHDIETEDTVQAMFEWPDGAIGSLHVSTAESGQPERLEILGTNGRLELTRGGLSVDIFEQDLRTFFVETEEIYRGPEQRPIEVTLPQSQGDHRDVYTNLHAAITAQAPVMADGAAARMSLELANAMILSSRRDTPVSFPLDRGEYLDLLTELQANGRTFA